MNVPHHPSFRKNIFSGSAERVRRTELGERWGLLAKSWAIPKPLFHDFPTLCLSYPLSIIWSHSSLPSLLEALSIFGYYRLSAPEWSRTRFLFQLLVFLSWEPEVFRTWIVHWHATVCLKLLLPGASKSSLSHPRSSGWEGEMRWSQTCWCDRGGRGQVKRSSRGQARNGIWKLWGSVWVCLQDFFLYLCYHLHWKQRHIHMLLK